jgi:hypothetical protein
MAQSRREITSGGKRTEKVEYHWEGVWSSVVVSSRFYKLMPETVRELRQRWKSAVGSSYQATASEHKAMDTSVCVCVCVCERARACA